MSAVVTLLRHHWRRHRVPLAPMALALVLFELLITRIAPGPGEASWVSDLFAALPPELLAVVGDDVTAITPAGFIAIGYGHPFLLLLLSAWIVRVTSAALAGEIGLGTMDLLASRPLSRGAHVWAAAIAVAAGLTMLVAAAWAGTAMGLATRPLGVTARQLWPMAAMLWLLFATFAAVGLAVSATRRDAGAAIGWLSGIIATSFVLEYIARLWKPMAPWRPLSLFTYYMPQHAIRSGAEPADVLRLTAVLAVAAWIAFAVFKRRDL